MKNLPEKIYLNFGEITNEEFETDDYNEFCKLDEFAVTFCEDRIYDTDVEYVRKDAFIEKVLKYLDADFYFNNSRYSIECRVFDSKEEMFEDFKKNMEVQEQKPTWSEEDERMLNSTIWHLRHSVNNGDIEYSAGLLEDWLESLKDRIK